MNGIRKYKKIYEEEIENDFNDLYKKLKIIRNQGQTKRYHHTMLGNNFRMTDIMASIGIEQLKKIVVYSP